MNTKFLLDENVSPKTTLFLRSLGLNVSDVRELNLTRKSDDEIYEYAKKEKSILVTFDHEFGYFYISRKDLEGLIIIRVHPQTFEILHPILKKFFKTVQRKKIEFTKKIIVIEKFRFRIRKIS